MVMQWDTILSLLPPGWEEQARITKAFVRSRKFKSCGDLLRILLIHAMSECPLRMTAALATAAKLADITDMAIHKRMAQSVELLEWMVEKMLIKMRMSVRVILVEMPIHIVDATTARQPGSMGTNQRLHLVWDVLLQIPVYYLVSTHKTGETFYNFIIVAGTLYIGDRGYGNRRGISYVVRNGGYVLVRINAHNLPLQTPEGNKFDLLGALRMLPEGEIGEWPVVVKGEDGPITGRVCALRVDPEARTREEKKVRSNSRKKHHSTKPETLEMAGYLVTFTTLGFEQADTRKVLDCFRARWQVEISIKGHKQMLNLGENPKKDPRTSRAWMLLKLLSFLLIEDLRLQTADFSPSEHRDVHATAGAMPVA